MIIIIIILAILLCVGASSIDHSGGPNALWERVCEKLLIAIMSVWAVGATLVPIAMCIALLLFLCKLIGLL